MIGAVVKIFAQILTAAVRLLTFIVERPGLAAVVVVVVAAFAASQTVHEVWLLLLGVGLLLGGARLRLDGH